MNQKPSLLLKTITLSAFVLLMGAFVAFKSGAFQKKERGNNDTPSKDSAIHAPVMVMPGTKSSVVFPQTDKPVNNNTNNSNSSPNQANAPGNSKTSSPPPEKSRSQKKKKKQNNNTMVMPGSKSAPVFGQ